MKNPFKKHLKFKIWEKLFFPFILVSLVPMLYLSSYLIINSRKMIIEQHNSQLSLENKRVRSIIYNVTYLTSKISDSIFYDFDFKEIVSSKYDNEADIYEAYRNFDVIKKAKNNYTEISSIKIYVSNPTLLTNGPFVVLDENIMNSSWYKNFSNSSKQIMWLYDNSFDYSSSLFLIRKVPIPNSLNYAIIVIGISDNYLKLMLNNELLLTTLNIDYSTIFYSDNRYEKGCNISDVFLNSPSDYKNESVENYYDNNKVLIYSSIINVSKGNNILEIVTIDQNAFKNLSSTINITIKMIGISIIIPIIFIVIFSFNFSFRIVTLRKQMGKVANGDFNIIDKFKGNDELSELFKDIKVTITKIQGLNKQIYEEKLEKQELENIQQKIEFEMLASQINPHFLYNTLETIRMKLIINGENEVARIVRQLGQFMRHNIETSNCLVSLNSELDYINIYMGIQQFRFGDRVSYSISIDNYFRPESYSILPLLLQPIIENALIHGVEGKKTPTSIKITILPQNNLLLIKITDNGKGMSQARLEYIRHSLSDSTSKRSKNHIGMHNVLQRIRLYYGIQYGLTIDSKENTYTSVTITLPLEEDPFYEINNS